MKNKKIITFAFISIIFLLFFPLFILAQTAPNGDATQNTGGIVPCGNSGGSPCTLCHLLVGIQKLVNWGKNVLVVLAIVGITFSGIMYIISSGSETMMKQAKAFLSASLIGFSVTLAAWLIVNTVLWLIAANSPVDGVVVSQQWNNITCDTTSTAGMGGGAGELQPQKCCVKSTEEGQGDYGKSSNCNSPQGQTPAECEQQYGCNQMPTEEEKKKCKENCAGSKPSCPEGSTLKEQSCSSLKECGSSIGTGCAAIVRAAEQFDAQNCQYSQPLRNGCGGNPAYTDCSNLVDTCYRAAGCNSPGNVSGTIGSNGEQIGDISALKAGDVLWKPGHVAICKSDGCGTVIHASGQKDDIKESGGSYPSSFNKVVHASKYCNSCQ